VEDFIAQRCAQTPGKHTVFAEFLMTVSSNGSVRPRDTPGRRTALAENCPVRHKTISGTDHAKFVPHLTLKPAEKEKP